EFLDYYRANQSEIAEAVRAGEKFQISNTGPIVSRGSYDVPAFPPPHPGEAPPPAEPPGPDQILNEPVCGYLLTEEQYNGPRSDSPPGFPHHGRRAHRGPWLAGSETEEWLHGPADPA